MKQQDIVKELIEIIGIIEPYDHPEFLAEHKSRLWEFINKLEKEAKDEDLEI